MCAVSRDTRPKPNQSWAHTGEGYLQSALNGMVLDINPEGGAGRTWTKEGLPRQRWHFG